MRKSSIARFVVMLTRAAPKSVSADTVTDTALGLMRLSRAHFRAHTFDDRTAIHEEANRLYARLEASPYLLLPDTMGGLYLLAADGTTCPIPGPDGD